MTTLSGGPIAPITGSSEASVPSGSFQSVTTTITVSSANTATGSKTVLVGTNKESLITSNGTPANPTQAANTLLLVSSTSTSVLPVNTQPCNGFLELCSRKYSNITQVAAHNSGFHIPGNAASNQFFDVTTQLNDGIRLLQTQTHIVNGVVHMCHTSCFLLDAGPLVTYLTTIASWVKTHPYDVVTILIENGDNVNVSTFVGPIQDSGLMPFAYIPPKIPMDLGDWPTLESMILSGTRVVFLLDFLANQTQIPILIDEFSQMWETPFDPTNASFPCTVQRPPGLSDADARNRMYMANHNRNTAIDLLGNVIDVPTIPLLPITNGVSGFGSLGAAAQTCVDMWNRAPNWLDVDFYNIGDGSVFEVAAKWNNVVYNRTCCGAKTSGAIGSSSRDLIGPARILAAIIAVLTCWVLS